MNQLIAIAAGGSLGAIARFAVANGIYAWLGRGFPHGTLFVNVSGSFLMGLLTELLLQRFALAVEWRAAILVGFLGAYTTFSTFALETLYLFEQGSLLKAGLNIFLSTVLCLAAVWIGLVLGRQLFADDLYPWMGHGFPYLDLGLSVLLTLLLAMTAEMLFQHLSLGAELRAVVLICLLGGVSLAATLWLMFKMPDVQSNVQGLLSIFAINALSAVAAVWLGMQAGGWLWKMSPAS